GEEILDRSLEAGRSILDLKIEVLPAPRFDGADVVVRTRKEVEVESIDPDRLELLSRDADGDARGLDAPLVVGAPHRVEHDDDMGASLDAFPVITRNGHGLALCFFGHLRKFLCFSDTQGRVRMGESLRPQLTSVNFGIKVCIDAVWITINSCTT